MSATRTQIYLTDEQRERIDRAATAEGITMAEVIRRAVDQFVDDRGGAAALQATFGAVPDATPPSRDEWPRG
ncbi:MAG: CopG family transcriptional regulator [Acidimicrobiia bacterium]|nr:CopG family transcriptional regulator [Acidimicrobiia bacterium]